MLLAATKLFSEKDPNFAKTLYQAALNAAEATWKYGLIKKGTGLCHGILGNSLLMHSVARWHAFYKDCV